MLKHKIKVLTAILALTSSTGLANELKTQECLTLQHKAHLVALSEKEDLVLQAIQQYAPDIYDYALADFKSKLKQYQNYQYAAEDLIEHHHEWLKGKDPAMWLLYSRADNEELSADIPPFIPKQDTQYNMVKAQQFAKEYGETDPYMQTLAKSPETSKTYNAVKVQAIELAAKNGFPFNSEKQKIVRNLDCFAALDSSLKTLSSLNVTNFFADKRPSRKTVSRVDVDPSTRKNEALPITTDIYKPTITQPKNQYFIPQNNTKNGTTQNDQSAPASRYIVLPQ